MNELLFYILFSFKCLNISGLPEKIHTEIDEYLEFLDGGQDKGKTYSRRKYGVIMVNLFSSNDCAFLELRHLREYRDRKKYNFKQYVNFIEKKGYIVFLNKMAASILEIPVTEEITKFQVDSILKNKLHNIEENPYVIVSSRFPSILVRICKDSISRRAIYSTVNENVQKSTWDNFWNDRRR